VTNAEPQREWYRVDVEAIAAQLPYEVLPIYVKQAPSSEGSESNEVPPYRSELEPDLSEGPHLGYAIQWFIFAAILGVGYIGYVSKSKRTE
jgi:surfeit locus 1 family protein